MQLTALIPSGSVAIDKDAYIPIQLLLVCTEHCESVTVQLKDEQGELHTLTPPTHFSETLTFTGRIYKPVNCGALVNEIIIKTPKSNYLSKLMLNWLDNILTIEADTVVGSGALSGHAHIKARTYVYKKQIELDKKSQHSFFQTDPLPLYKYIPEKLIHRPLYARVKAGDRTESIQSFRAKASFGRGDLNKKRDADVRLFQPLYDRFSNSNDIVNNDFKAIASINSMARCLFELRFNNHGQLIFNHLAQTAVPVLPKVNNQEFKQAKSYSYTNDDDFETHSLTLDSFETTTEGIRDITLAFNDTGFNFHIKYAPSVYATIYCEQLPHLGHIYLFNKNYEHVDKMKIPLEEIKNIRLQTNKNQWLIGPQDSMKHISQLTGAITEVEL